MTATDTQTIMDSFDRAELVVYFMADCGMSEKRAMSIVRLLKMGEVRELLARLVEAEEHRDETGGPHCACPGDAAPTPSPGVYWRGGGVGGWAHHAPPLPLRNTLPEPANQKHQN